MPTDHNIRQLVINKMTDAQYEQAVKSADELYLTPDDGSGGGTDLPDQTGQSGKFLTTNGSTLSWGSVPAGTVTSVRVQAGTGLSSSQSTAQSSVLNTTISIASGYKLPTTTEWNNNVLPSQSGNEGKFLTTNGSTTSWTTISGGSDIDNSTITENASNQIQTVGIKDVRTDNTIKTWTGTKAQYDALTPSEWSTATQDTNLGNRNWYNLVYDGSKYIALSTNGYISTSTDGETWTTATQNATLTGSTYGGWYTLAYGGSKFVTLSDSEYVSTSTNGTTWTTPSYNSTISTQDNYKCLVYGNNKFVAISDGGFVTTSTNGTTWTTATSTGLHDFYALTYDGSKFIALNTSGYICTSTDGTTWTSTQISSLNRYSWYNLIYDGNKLTALTDNGYISTSTDGGFTWTNPTLVNNLANKTWYAITYDGSKFIAISTDGYISTKNEGAGIQSNTLYNIENYGLYLGSTEIANVGGGGGGGSGTVTSVRVQAGTGLTSSQSTAQTQVLNTTISVASGYKLPTTTEWNNKQDALPSQTGNSGKFLTTNGSSMSWETVDALPSQTGNAGKFLTTNGTTASWQTVSGGGGNFLIFNDVVASNWVVDNTYADYGYKCELTCNGVTADDFAQVIFYPPQSTNGDYANICLTSTDTVTIYSKVNTSITIPTIYVYVS